MTIDVATVRYMRSYSDREEPTGVLVRQANMPLKPNNSNKLRVHVRRNNRAIATAITPYTGSNLNTHERFSVKEFEPAYYGEGTSVFAKDLTAPTFGETQEQVDPEVYKARLLKKILDFTNEANDMLKRALELQAAQVMQTGTLDLRNREGSPIYQLDFGMRATHRPSASVPWSNRALSTPIDDIRQLAQEIRNNGMVEVDQAFMSVNTWQDFMESAQVKEYLSNQRFYQFGELKPEYKGSGVSYVGRIYIGDVWINFYTYNATYNDPATGALTQYISDGKVILNSENTRYDLESVEVATLAPPPAELAGLLPQRMFMPDSFLDVKVNADYGEMRRSIDIEVLTTALFIPVQIDGFGCLSVN